MTTTVIDASVLVKLLVREQGFEAAQAALEHGGEWIAPDWLMIEVASALSQKVRFDQLPPEHAFRAMETSPAFVDRFVATAPLLSDALVLSIELGHAVYDCLYLVLARREKGKMLTADAKFVKKLGRHALASHVELLA